MDSDLDHMSRRQLIQEARKLRSGIRTHRDSNRHELCWHHPALWSLLPEKSDPLPEVPEWPEFLQGCLNYRQSLDERPPALTRLPSPSVERNNEMPTTIEKGGNILTLVNVFTVEPEKQLALVEILIEATEQTMKGMPGFISANIHRSLDGKKVVNYAQWESMAAFEEMRKNPKAIPHMQAAAAIAQFEPILCEVSEAIGV